MKKLIIVLVLLATSLYGQFTYYDIPEVPTVVDLTTIEKEVAIDKFALGWSVTNMVKRYEKPRALVDAVFDGIEVIEAYAFRCMSGTVVESFDEGTPIYYNKTVTQVALLNMVNTKFSNHTDITVYLLEKMVDYSKKDGSGTWVFYLSQFGD